MTVLELIKLLEQVPPESTVFTNLFPAAEALTVGSGRVIIWAEHLPKS